MTDTARHADIVLPATMFLEHDDIYTASAHQISAVRAEGDRAAGGLPLQPRGHLRARQARRRRASRLRDEPARNHRRDAAGLRPRRSRRAREGALARLPAAVRGGAFPQRLRASRTANSISAPTGRTSPYDNDGLVGRWRELPTLPDHWAANEARGRRRIRSSSRPRRRAASSIRASTRRRPRARASGGRAR